MVRLIIMTAVAAIVTLVLLIVLLSTKGLSYLGCIPQVMHQDEELILG